MLISMLTRRSSCLLFMAAALLLLGGCASSSRHAATPSACIGSEQGIVLASAQRSEVVLTAMGLMESDYRYGGSHPDAGFDCSGLVAYVFGQAASTRLPHNTQPIRSDEHTSETQSTMRLS